MLKALRRTTAITRHHWALTFDQSGAIAVCGAARTLMLPPTPGPELGDQSQLLIPADLVAGAPRLATVKMLLELTLQAPGPPLISLLLT